MPSEFAWLMGFLGTGLIAGGVVFLCVFFPLGFAMILFGILFLIVGILAGFSTQRGRHFCPACHGDLGNGRPRICRYCRTEIYWPQGRAITRQDFEGGEGWRS